MKVAVVGCGNVSVNHFAAIRDIPGAEAVAAVDIKKERAERYAHETGARAYTDFDEMLKTEKPDVVHIATPHWLHTPMAVKALDSGAHVFLEKPCSVTSEEADALAKAQERSGKQVAVCFQNRYNDSSITLKEIVDSGKYGKIKSVRGFVTWDRGREYYSDDWHGTLDKECGGVLINQAIHTLDLILFIAGPCKEVTAHVFNDHLKGIIEVEDTAYLRMKLESGICALLLATTAFSGNSPVMIEVSLENALFRLEGELLYKIAPDGKADILCARSDEQFSGKSYWGHGHKAIIRDFYNCIETGRKFSIDAYEGGKALKTVAAAYKSSRNNTTEAVK
jgi:predicted dehydrogenase